MTRWVMETLTAHMIIAMETKPQRRHLFPDHLLQTTTTAFSGGNGLWQRWSDVLSTVKSYKKVTVVIPAEPVWV